MGRCSNCHCAFDLENGEMCEYCGTFHYENDPWNITTPSQSRTEEVELFFYKSKREKRPDGSPKWIKCSTENSCKIMARCGLEVKRVLATVVVK